MNNPPTQVMCNIYKMLELSIVLKQHQSEKFYIDWKKNNLIICFIDHGIEIVITNCIIRIYMQYTGQYKHAF